MNWRWRDFRNGALAWLALAAVAATLLELAVQDILHGGRFWLR